MLDVSVSVGLPDKKMANESENTAFVVEEGVNFDLSTDSGFSLSTCHEFDTIIKKTNAGQCSAATTGSAKGIVAKSADFGWIGVAVLVVN